MTPPGTSVVNTNGASTHDEKEPVSRMTDSPTQLSDSSDTEVDDSRRHGHGRFRDEPDNSDGTDEDDDVDDEEGEDEEDEDEDVEEEDDEDEEDDDDEPALKYERIGGSVPDLLKKDSASSLAVANKLMVTRPHSYSSLPSSKFSYRHWGPMAELFMFSISMASESSLINHTLHP